MPDKPSPATQPESGAAPGELNFAQPVPETSRIKRRSLKAKTEAKPEVKKSGLQPAGGIPPAARELEREAPPLSTEITLTTRPSQQAPVARTEPKVETRTEPTARPNSPVTAPPRTTPAVTTTTSAKPAANGNTPARPAPGEASSPSPVATKTALSESATKLSSATATTTSATPSIRSTATPTTSPHGTRPATLYYSSQPKKAETPAETPTPMKTIPTPNSASTSTASSSATAIPTSVTRPAASASRPTTSVDYRANVERQSREQKSVGNILSYIVYGFIALFLITVCLAGYGAKVIFAKINDQSQTVTELDARYAAANKDLLAKLSATQDTLAQAQTEITRQQDLINRQQDAINKVTALANGTASDLKKEAQARATETTTLRARVRDLDSRIPASKY